MTQHYNISGVTDACHRSSTPDAPSLRGLDASREEEAIGIEAPVKPELVVVQFNRIPVELIQIPQWVLWRYELVAGWQEKVFQGKKPWTKVPYQPNGRKASSTRQATWNSFETIRERYEKDGFDGVGFVLTSECGIVGIDMDAQLADERWSDDVKAQVKALGTYGEVSPSGRGVRFFGRGHLDKGGKSGDFEIYKTGRFLTVTGYQLEGAPNTVNECSGAIASYCERYITKKRVIISARAAIQSLDDITDEALIEKAMKAKNGGTFASLWRGQELDGKSSSEGDAALCYSLAFWASKDAVRIERLLGLSARVRDKWNEPRGETTWIRREIEKAIEATENVYDPRHPALRAPDPQQIAARKAERFDFAKEEQSDEIPEITRGYPTTDTGNAERFIAQHGHKFLYSPALGWLIWDGWRWVDDERGIIGSWEKKTVRSIYAEAQGESDERRPILGKWAANSESASRRNAMMENVRKDGPRAIPSDFDTDQMAFNVVNGTIDLRSGELLPHNRSNYISKVALVKFDARAKCPLWLDTLSMIFEGSQDLLLFFQRAVGYSLTGLTWEQCFFVLHGQGANGKSLIFAILQKLFGDYQTHAAPATLMHKRADAIPNDVAMLRGARLVTSTETNEGRRMDEALVKAMTGDDPVTARFLRKEFFTFIPQFKIFLATNHKPQIIGTDDGIWRRIRLIPFNVRFWDPDKGETGPAYLQADKTRKERLLAELPGILNWAVDGCLSWQEDGLPSPQSVREATGSYRDECDPIRLFLEECAVLTEQARVTKADLHKAFAKWAEDNEQASINKNAFGMRLKQKGFTDMLGTGGTRFWLGISLPGTNRNFLL